ncbi:polysaccharide deacetylase family protein, partial [Tractidigestivibacter sp.]|uniref:polysaccharide deacetylase family protein n=1 Tax=Tractidigestivibacter sp. TaxID=2847320 RepID=UPI002A81ED6C
MSVGVILAIAVCVVAAWALLVPRGAGGTPTTDSAQQGAQPDGPSDDGAGAAAEPAQGGEGATPSEDPRAAEFAVNPDARTEWSYKNNGERIVYLTFDDGPSKNTQRVLDILDRYGAKATFFVVGHDPDHYDMIKRAYDD